MDLSDKCHPRILHSSFGVFYYFIGQLLGEIIGLWQCSVCLFTACVQLVSGA